MISFVRGIVSAAMRGGRRDRRLSAPSDAAEPRRRALPRLSIVTVCPQALSSPTAAAPVVYDAHVPAPFIFALSFARPPVLL